MNRSPLRTLVYFALPVVLTVVSCFAEPGLPSGAPDDHVTVPEAGAAGESRGGRGGNAGRSGRDGGEGGVPPVPSFGAFGGEGGVPDPLPSCPSGVPLRTAPADAECRPPATHENLPARPVVSDVNAAKVDTLVFTADLFTLFKAQCGGCHVDTTRGELHVSPATFATAVTSKSIERMQSDDPTLYMPPPGKGGKPWSARPPGDPIRELVSLIQRWLDAGSPRDLFVLPAAEAGLSRYYMPEPLAQSLTNLGTCIPEPALVATEQDSDCQLDARFAALKKVEGDQASAEEQIGLPLKLEQTDLVSLDSAVLARHGVIGFAPGYPLWSDDAGKLRHVRVPVGQSIHFNKQTQEFDIPDNTRFYKTFFKKVLDLNGMERWKKLETRLIVARAEDPLFGTYVWNEQETQADLLRDAYRDGTPFRDRVQLVVTDEKRAKEILDSKPNNVTYEFERAKILRRYAIPGRERCIQCHQGSTSSSFVLGFSPMQIWRRPAGEGGVIEPSGPDELNQLERLIDYGIITGLESATEIVPLELSQQPRLPRNEYELLAQGYMIGNCAHCHNPRGFPSVEHPELAPLLNFWPTGGGGIFEFPLEAVSPRIRRGIDGTISLPYITPSIRDLYPLDTLKWTPKHEVQVQGATLVMNHLDAPWRSLIWRNVDTPFAYADDFAIFPHMPMHTPGYDCRVAQILGDWMVSIPATRIHPELSEDRPPENDTPLGISLPPVDRTPQPYAEVKLGQPGYDQAKRVAERRLAEWQAGERYGFCPDIPDIVDPNVASGDLVVPVDGEVGTLLPWNNGLDGVPDRPHWVETDLTDLPPPWYPRRFDWDTILVKHEFPTLDPRARDYAEQLAKQNAEKQVVDMLTTTNGGVRLTDEIKAYGLAKLPFGLWTKKDQCDFTGVPKASDYQGAARPNWMWMAHTPPDAPVYETLPGAAIFDMICVNCHGRLADSKGIQAQKVAELTGGRSRVANFMSGLFGPLDAPGANRATNFLDTDDASGTDWAARYLGWMALGGTEAPIPAPVLDQVARTDVLGVSRGGLQIKATPNMLAVAQELCSFVLPNLPNIEPFGVEGKWTFDYGKTPLITTHGDAELWQKVCSLGNRQLVRALRGHFTPTSLTAEIYAGWFYDAAAYPANVPVGDHKGGVAASLSPDNLFPWCITKPIDPGQYADALTYLRDHRVGGQELPFCPDQVMSQGPIPYEDRATWATRGALNAGLYVFLFLDELAHGRVNRVRYNECENL